MALSVENSGGEQSTTQNPQIAGQPANNGAPSGSVQPGTSTNLLSGQGTIPLSNTPVTTVNLSPTTAAAQLPAKQPVKAAHHISPFLIIVAAVLLLVAAASVFFINRSAKNTTL